MCLPRTGQHFLSVRHPMRKIPQPQVEPSHRFHRRRSCHGHGLIRRKICLMADWSSPESLRKLSHPLQRSSSIYHRPLSPGWKKAKTAKTLKMGKKRICQSPTGAARSMCRTKKAAGHWKAPMSLKQSCRRSMSWQRAWMRWWWKCPWREIRRRCRLAQ